MTRVEWVRRGMAVHDAKGAPSEYFTSYNAARKREQSVKTIQSAPLVRVKQRWDEFLRAGRVRERVLAEARARLVAIAFEKTRAEACHRLAAKLDPIQRFLFLSLDLTSESGRIGLVCGEPAMAAGCMPADTEPYASFYLSDSLQRLLGAEFEDGVPTGYAMGAISAAFMVR